MLWYIIAAAFKPWADKSGLVSDLSWEVWFDKFLFVYVVNGEPYLIAMPCAALKKQKKELS